MLEKVLSIGSTSIKNIRRKGGMENIGETERQWGDSGEPRCEEIGGQRKGVPRNILTSPWIPSCVLNHFPVDSAVCNPIIGISPSGKLLFYSRTTQVPNVPCTTIFSLSFSPSSSILPASLFSCFHPSRF